MSDGNTVHYVYGIAREGIDTGEAPPGIGGTGVRSVRSDGLCALVSDLDSAEYAPQLVEERSGDVQWLAPRAEAHDSVVTWAGEPGPVLPLHMWTMFSDESGISEMLRRRSAELHELLTSLEGADEYGLRVYADAAEVERVAVARDPELAELARSAESAGPGERYLLERRIEKQRRDATRAAALAAADRVFDGLAAVSRSAARDSIPNAGAAEAGAVLSAAFLIPRERLDRFRRELTGLVRDMEPQGFRFTFTGPWPPYHFTSMGA